MKQLMKYMTPSGKFDFNNASEEEFILAFESLELFPISKELSEKTEKAYKQDLREFLDFLKKEELNLQQMNVWIVQEYTAMINRKFSARSAKRKLVLFKRILRFGHRYNYYQIELESEVKMPKVSKYHESVDEHGESQVRDMDLKTANLIISALPKIVKTQRDIADIIKLRNRIIGMFLLGTGMRASEIINLKWSNIKNDPEDGYFVKFKGKGSKERSIPLSDDLVALLIKLREQSGYEPNFEEDRRPLLVNYHSYNKEEPKPITYIYLYKMIEKAVNYVIKEITKINNGITPHWFRHTFITASLEQDVPLILVRDMAGHSDVSTTNLYADKIKDKSLRKEMKRVKLVSSVENI